MCGLIIKLYGHSTEEWVLITHLYFVLIRVALSPGPVLLTATLKGGTAR